MPIVVDDLVSYTYRVTIYKLWPKISHITKCTFPYTAFAGSHGYVWFDIV
jgi:hypothetical protein